MWKALDSVTPSQEICELPQTSKADILKIIYITIVKTLILL